MSTKFGGRSAAKLAQHKVRKRRMNQTRRSKAVRMANFDATVTRTSSADSKQITRLVRVQLHVNQTLPSLLEARFAEASCSGPFRDNNRADRIEPKYRGPVPREAIYSPRFRRCRSKQ